MGRAAATISMADSSPNSCRKHLPGNPTIVPQNMPGGGSFVAAKYMDEVAPKDGTVFGSLAQTLALDSAVNPATKLDVDEFPLSSAASSPISTPARRCRRAASSRSRTCAQKQYTVGASGGGSTTVLFPSALNAYGGAKFKIVRGYKGTTDILLAMERGEVDIVGAYGLPGILVSHPGWIDKGEAIDPLSGRAQAAPAASRMCRRCRNLRPATRAAWCCAPSPAPARSAARSSPTPGVPAERLAALRAAFQAMLKDPDFLAACEKRQLMVDPGTGEEMDAIVQETFALSPALLAKIGEMSGRTSTHFDLSPSW